MWQIAVLMLPEIPQTTMMQMVRLRENGMGMPGVMVLLAWAIYRWVSFGYALHKGALDIAVSMPTLHGHQRHDNVPSTFLNPMVSSLTMLWSQS
jgi:hypothetical protein